MGYKTGDVITIRVDGRPYKTYIDENGTQRFPYNSAHPLWDRWKGDDDGERKGRGTEDMNNLAVAYHRKEFDQRTYMEFNMSIGYSVCGFQELSSFDDLLLINPIWGETDDHVGDDTYLYANLENGTFTLEEVLQKIVVRDQITYTEAQALFVKNYIG